MKKLLDAIRGKRDFSYLLDKSINLMKKYRTNINECNQFDLIVKKIRGDDEWMSCWVGDISENFLKICNGKTMDEQKTIMKQCIMQEIEICSIAQEYFPAIHSKDDLVKIAGKFNKGIEIEEVLEKQHMVYILSQANLFTLEYLLISEYREKNSEWVYVFSFVTELWVRALVQSVLEENPENRLIIGVILKKIIQFKAEFTLSILRGEDRKFNTEEINYWDDSSIGPKRLGIIHCNINFT